MHPALYPFLKAQQKLCGLNRKPTDYVFPGIGRERLNGKLGEWAELRGRSGRKGYMDFTFHHLRHTYVSRLLVDSAIPIAHVAHQIGDKIQTVYETYADLIQRRESGIHVAAHARTFR